MLLRTLLFVIHYYLFLAKSFKDYPKRIASLLYEKLLEINALCFDMVGLAALYAKSLSCFEYEILLEFNADHVIFHMVGLKATNRSSASLTVG